MAAIPLSETKRAYSSIPRESPTPSGQHYGYAQYAELAGGDPIHTEGPDKKPRYVNHAELPDNSQVATIELAGEHAKSPVELDAGATLQPTSHTRPQPQYP
jgi:hypothetical protein